jgi:energy-coupling factor transporter ATP-binding protein EcfA2
MEPMDPERITYFAETDARSKRIPFGIKAKDRTRHVYVIGKTGMGKSTLLENMAVQDIKNGEGMAFLDPHGKSAELLLEYIPQERMKDVLYFAPFDTDFPISFNVLESVDPDKRHLVVSGLMSTFKKIWQDAWSARMEYILTNTLLALLEYPGATLLGVNRMLAEKDFRKDVVDHITDISVKNFWTKEFANYTERMAAEAVPAIQNKIGQFTANALIRNMIGQAQSSFDIRKMMDDRKILIINLSKGKIGESNANLLGGMLITKIYLAAMSRADLPNRVMATMPNFYLYVDEFQSFANESFADILSEARKYHLNLTIAHQYIEQMEEEVRAAVFGNVGTMIIFRVGAYDAEVLEKEFAPTFTAEDIVNLGQYQIYLKLMIDGISSQPFSATNLPPIKPPEVDHVADVVAASREQFAHKRADVEGAINDWHKPIMRAPPQPLTVAAPVSARPAPIAPPVAPKPAVQPVFKPALVPAASATSAPVSTTPVPVHTPARTSPTPISTPAPAPIKPFKEAFQKAAVPTPPTQPTPTQPQPVSLSTLAKPVVNPKNDQKTPTPKNVNDLKNALASIIGATPVSSKPKEKTVEKSAEKTQEKQSAPKETVKETLKESAKEVPKDVLEKILKMN